MGNHRLLDIGVLEETTEGTSDVAYASPYYHLGLKQSDFEFPMEKQSIFSTTKGGNRDPTQQEVVKTFVDFNLPFTYVNAYPWAFHIANIKTPAGIAESPAGTFTFTPIDTGEKTPFSIKWESSDGTTRIQKEAVGCKTYQLASNIEFKTNQTLQGTLSGYGRQLNTKAFTARQEPVFPDGNALSTQTPYKYDSNTSVIWDYGVGEGFDNVDITTDLRNFNWICVDNTIYEHIHGQKYPWKIRTGNQRNWFLSFETLRDSLTDILDDYLTQPPANVFKNLRFKIYNSASKYQQWDFTEVALQQVRVPHVNEQGEDETRLVMAAKATSAILTTIDGTTSARYGL